jgi:ribosomal-protein-serine acetyltransferase
MPTKPTTLPDLLVTRRLALRRHTVDLAPAKFSLVDAERARLGTFLYWVQRTRTIEDERLYLRNSRKDWDEARTFDYGIFDGTTNEFVGCIGAHTIRWEHDCAELGFWLSSRFEGRGIIGEAVRCLEEELQSLRFHRLEIRCDSRNTRSAAVAKRSGYQLDGVLKNNVFEGGSYRDTMVWGKVFT